MKISKSLLLLIITSVMALACGCATGKYVDAAYVSGPNVPSGFVYVDKVVPNIVLEMRYASKNNFTGRVIDGYEAPKCILTEQAAEALGKVQEELGRYSMSLKILDAYRPQRAVDDFIRWANNPADTCMRNEYYPDIPKTQLFSKGYISMKSGHSRGSTVDLTIIMLPQRQELSMGGNFDYFGEISNTEYKNVKPFQKVNRLLLKTIMEKHGFMNYDMEWWHFTLRNEPFPDTYFNFPVK